MAVIDSYSEINQDSDFSIRDDFGARGVGQSVTGDGKRVTDIQWYLKKVNTPTANLTANIYAHSGVFGNDGIPTGAAIATSAAVAASSLSTSYGLITFTFTNGPILTAGTNYVITVEGIFTGTSRPAVGYDSTSPTHAGNFCSKDSSDVWSPANTNDACFYLNGISVGGSPRRVLGMSQAVKRASFW